MQRNIRPVFEGHRRDGLGGKKARRKRNQRCSCVWMACGSCGGRKQKPKARQRQERAFLEHKRGGGVQQSWDTQSAVPAGHGCMDGTVGQVKWQVQVPGAAELGEGEDSSTVEAVPQ